MAKGKKSLVETGGMLLVGAAIAVAVATACAWYVGWH